MQFDESRAINVLLSPKRSEAELAADLQGKIGQIGDLIQTITIQISNRMRADLSGSAFTIQPITPSVQAVRTDGTTQWSWTIVPTKPGEQSLDLTISALITVSGNDTPIVIETFKRQFL